MGISGTVDSQTLKLFEEEAMRAEHIMGLHGYMGLGLGNEEIHLRQSTGGYSSVSLGYINEKIDSYLSTLSSEEKKDWQKISAAFKKAQGEATNGGKVTCVADNLRRIRAGKDQNSRELVHLGNSGWFGEDSHSIGVTFYGGYMAVCDRGLLGSNQNCTKIYKIDPNKITHQQLARIQSSPEDPHVILDTIQEMAGHQDPIATFPSKAQKFNTCTYANRMGSTEAMLCLVKLDRAKQLNDESIRAYAENKDRSAYKNFTNYNRDTEVERLISKMKRARSPQLQAMYASVAIHIVRYREPYLASESNPIKAQAEKERSDKLIRAVETVYGNVNEYLTTNNKSFYVNYLLHLPKRNEAIEQPSDSVDVDALMGENPVLITGSHTSKRAHKSVSETVVKEASVSFTQIKTFLNDEAIKKQYHITKVEVQPLGFQPDARLKLEIQSSSDVKPATVYVDEAKNGGVTYSVDKDASAEQNNQSIETICKIVVAKSTKDTEFNLDDTPDDLRTDVESALKKAISEKYKDQEAPKIISSKTEQAKNKAG